MSMIKQLLVFSIIAAMIIVSMECNVGYKNAGNGHVFRKMRSCDECGWAIRNGNKHDCFMICFERPMVANDLMYIYDSIHDGVTYIRNYGERCMEFDYVTGSYNYVNDDSWKPSWQRFICHKTCQGANNKDMTVVMNDNWLN